MFRYKLHNKILKGKVFHCYAANWAVRKLKNCESGRSKGDIEKERRRDCDSDKHFNAGDTGKQKDPTACDVSKRSAWERRLPTYCSARGGGASAVHMPT